MFERDYRLIGLSVASSLIFHCILALLIIALFGGAHENKPHPVPREYFVDIVTLPKKGKSAKQLNEKHKVAANISRKGIAKKYSKIEKLPLAMTNRKAERMVIPERKTSVQNEHRKLKPEKKRVKQKTKLAQKAPVKKAKQSVKKSLLAKKTEKRSEKKRQQLKITSLKGALYNPFIAKPNPGFPSGEAKEYRYRRAKREATVSIGTQSIKYASYMQHVRDQIEGVWEYPEEAQMRNEQGDLLVLFSIGRDGRLVGLKLLRSSGFSLLDRAALNAIREAAPFPPLPGRLHIDRLNIYATFSYRLYSWFIQ